MSSRFALALALFATLGCGGDRRRQPEVEDAAPPPPPPRLARSEPQLPPDPPPPIATLGRGQRITYPVPEPLTLADGVPALSPPMRVQVLLPIPERRLATASGRVSSGQAVALIDLESATIRWRDVELCGGPVVHTSSDRVICAGWKGIVALDVNSGRLIWKSPLMFRAAGGGYVFGRDPENSARGAILDVATGRVISAIEPPIRGESGKDLDEVKRICPRKDGFDLFAWSPEGKLRRFRLPRRVEEVSLSWTRKLGAAPTRVDLCAAVMLVETPIPGRSLRKLRPLSRKSGSFLAAPLEQYGWWSASARDDAAGGHIEVATPTGLQIRDRKLGQVQVRSGNRLGGRLVAKWGGLRLVRSVAGTLLLIDEDGIREWLAAPARIENAVLTPTHVLAGSWLGQPRSGAENLSLFRIEDKPGSGFDNAPFPPMKPALVGNAVGQRLPPSGQVAARTIPFPKSGKFVVLGVELAAEDLYVAVSAGRPGPKRGAGLAAFELTSRSWRWSRNDACAENAEVVGIAVSDRTLVCAARAHFPGAGSVRAHASKTGEPAWTREFSTVDSVLAAGSAVVVLEGSRAHILDADSGRTRYQLDSDNGHQPRVALAGGRVIAVETGGIVVARDPDGTPAWSVAMRGYVRALHRSNDAVAVQLDSGELLVLNAGNGAARAVGGWSSRWRIPGGSDLYLDDARGRADEFVVRTYGRDGTERFRVSYPTSSAWDVAGLRGPGPDAPLALVSRQVEPRVMQIDPGSGAVMAVHNLPVQLHRGSVFGAVIGGRATVGAVVRDPLAVVMFQGP